MHIKLLSHFALFAVFLAGCAQTSWVGGPTVGNSTMPSTEPSPLLKLSYPQWCQVTVYPNGGITLYMTIELKPNANGVYVFPFDDDAYVLSSPDIPLERIANISGSYMEHPHLDTLPVDFTESNLAVDLVHGGTRIEYTGFAVDLRLSPGEHWMYACRGLPAGFHTPFRLRLKYSYRGVESNEVEFLPSEFHFKQNNGPVDPGEIEVDPKLSSPSTQAK
jgi:hypothetical protein